MSRLKVFALFLALVAFGFAPSAKAQVNCDPAVMTAMQAQAQAGFNQMSLLTTQFLKAPVPTLASLCQQMVNSVWNPQRFLEESIMAPLTSLLGPMTYSWGSTPSFSLEFNPVNVALSTLLRSLMQSASLGFICTDAFDGIGNALRAVNYAYNPTTGEVSIGTSASLKATGPLSFINGMMAGAKISFGGNAAQVDP
jgi:hypothetical protein